MRKLYYIKTVESHIFLLNNIIESPRESSENKKEASEELKVVQEWVNILRLENLKKQDAEKLLKQLYNIEKTKRSKVFISKPFVLLFEWIKEFELLTPEIKSLRRKLFRGKAEIIKKCFEQQFKSDESNSGISIVQKWISTIYSPVPVQSNINFIMNTILSYNKFPGSLFFSMAFWIREWAEWEGYNVISEKVLKNHFYEEFFKMIGEEDKVLMDKMRKEYYKS